MASQTLRDPYALRSEDIETPPITVLGTLQRIGPGLIITATVVGTGELIATTVLGAENGYNLLWLVIVSCFIKVVVQNEMGRYTVGTGETALSALSHIPGPRFRVSWVVWVWFLMETTALTSLSGMFAGIAEVLNWIIPTITIKAWVWIVMLITLSALMSGRYRLIENVSTTLVATFTALTVSAAVLLGMRPEFFSWSRLAGGLLFRLPKGGFGMAVAVLGITGVGSSDLVVYPYWCIEKGYARFTGPRENTRAWLVRARGWIRVMACDVIGAMLLYTSATIAFYLLGAGVLHKLKVVPKGTETLRILSNTYTETLGDWSLSLFLVGAVAILYSSLFGGAASSARVFADFATLLGAYESNNYRHRHQAIQIFSGIVLIVPVIYYIALPELVLLIKIGGIAQALMLPIVGFSVLYLKYQHLPKSIAPKGWITLALWFTSIVTMLMVVYPVLQSLT